MTSREQLLAYAEEWKRHNPQSEDPIFMIYMMDFSHNWVTYNVPWLGYPVTFPCTGVIEEAMYDCRDNLDKSIEILTENQMDVHDGCFGGAFITLKIPGIPPFTTSDTRMFFVWDEEKDGYIQQEEPDIFRNFPIVPGF